MDFSAGVFSEANIDSTESIIITGEGGVGKGNIVGVALRMLDEYTNYGIIKTISADHQIFVRGNGGTGTDIVDSKGIHLSNVEVDAGKGIYLIGQAGVALAKPVTINSLTEYSSKIQR